jgi:hypothetical protein
VANGKSVAFNVTAAGDPTPTITATDLPSWLKLGKTTTKSGSATAKLSGKAPASSAGAFTLTIEASNGVSAPVYQTFTVNVLAVTSPKTADITAGQPVNLDVTSSDTPANPVLAVSGLPSGLTFTDDGNGNGAITGTVPAGRHSSGHHSVKITATSGSTVAKQTLVLIVSS